MPALLLLLTITHVGTFVSAVSNKIYSSRVLASEMVAGPDLHQAGMQHDGHWLVLHQKRGVVPDHVDHGHDDHGHGHDDHGYQSAGHDAHDPHGNGTGCKGEVYHKRYGNVQPGDGGHAVAIGLLAATIIIPITVYMALSKGHLGDLVIRLIDTFISLFLAMLWFTAFSCLLKVPGLQGLFPHQDIIFAFLQAIALYVVVVYFAYQWRDKHIRVLTFCGCGAHYIAFAGIRVTGETQYAVSEESPDFLGPWMSFAVVAAVFVFLMLLAKGVHAAYAHKLESPKLQEAIEELELDVVGLIISFGVTQTLQHCLMGHYPKNLHFFMQGGPHPVHATPFQCWVMLGWSCFLTITAGLVIPELDYFEESEESWVVKFARVLKVVFVMCIAWGYLLWGKWQFDLGPFRGHPMFGMMVFSVIVTMASLALLFVLSRLNFSNLRVRESVDICIMGASLVAAWSWEHCFVAAIDIVSKRYQVGYKGMVPKLLLATLIPAMILPVYVEHIKPKMIEIENRHREHRRQSRMSMFHGLDSATMGLSTVGASMSVASVESSPSPRANHHRHHNQRPSDPEVYTEGSAPDMTEYLATPPPSARGPAHQ